MLFAANSIFRTGVDTGVAPAVDEDAGAVSLTVLGAEYAGNVGGRTDAAAFISFSVSFASLVFAGIRDGAYQVPWTYQLTVYIL